MARGPSKTIKCYFCKCVLRAPISDEVYQWCAKCHDRLRDLGFDPYEYFISRGYRKELDYPLGSQPSWGDWVTTQAITFEGNGTSEVIIQDGVVYNPLLKEYLDSISMYEYRSGKLSGGTGNGTAASNKRIIYSPWR